MNTPAQRAARALHSHASGGAGAILAVGSALYPLLMMLTSQGFVRAVILNDPGARLTLIVCAITATAGALLALVGKGPLAAKADDTVLLKVSGSPPERAEDTMTTTNTGGGLANDAIEIAKQGLTALQAAADSILTGSQQAVPKVTGDVLKTATDFIDSHAPAGEIGAIMRGLVDAEAAAAAPTLDRLSTAAVAGIAVFKTDVDSAIGHLKNLL